MTHHRQAGSVASFIIVGVALVLVTAGLLYFAGQQRGIDTESAPIPEVAVTPPLDTHTKDRKSTEEAPAIPENDTDDSTADTRKPSGDSRLPDSSQDEAGQTVPELSHTGPTESLISIMAAGVITTSFVGYVQSRRRSTAL